MADSLHDLLGSVAFPETPEERDAAWSAIEAIVADAKAEALEEAADDYRHYQTPNARLYLRARARTVRGEG